MSDRNFLIMSKKESEELKISFFEELSKTYLDNNDSCSKYWYPLKKIRNDIPVVYYDSEFLSNESRLKCLQKILRNHWIKKVCVIPEFDEAYYTETYVDELLEKDEDGFIFPYESECFAFDDRKDWLIYKSHELTVAFAGGWLVEELKEVFGNKG